MDKTTFLVGRVQTSIHGRFSTDKRERKELLPVIVSRGLRIGLLLRHYPFISQWSDYDFFLVDYVAAITVLECGFHLSGYLAFLFRCFHEKVYFSFLALYIEKY